MSVFTTTIASFALAAASFAAGAPVLAAPVGDAPRVEVRYGDLDLTRVADVARLNRRIVSAAKAVCGSFDPRNFAETGHALACRNETIAAATPKVELAVSRATGADKLAGTLPTHTISVP